MKLDQGKERENENKNKSKRMIMREIYTEEERKGGRLKKRHRKGENCTKICNNASVTLLWHWQ